MYGSAGTGRWDIYGHGANLRFSDNDSAGSVVFDRNVDANGGIDCNGTLEVSSTSNFDGTLKIAEKIEHLGDDDTWFGFSGPNAFQLKAGLSLIHI